MSFLDAARKDTIWTKAKDTVTKNTGALSLEALKLAFGVPIKHTITGGTWCSSMPTSAQRHYYTAEVLADVLGEGLSK